LGGPLLRSLHAPYKSEPLKSKTSEKTVQSIAGVRSTAIYIDSNLGGGIKGEEIAKQIVALGFTEIWLCTGNEPEQYAHLTYLKGCVSKDAPWLK
jgi:hypothetical protein